jgi:disulfide bond formation protein DsbB
MNKLFQFLQPHRRLTAAIVLASVIILGAAYVSQYGFGLKPCILCLYQRVPYALNIAFGVIAFIATFRYPRLAAVILYLMVLSFLAGAVIAGFHVGVEYGWWKGLPSCGGQILPEHATIEQLREALENQNIVRCDKPAWTMFGISMAGYNFMMSLALSVGTLYLLRKGRHAA